MPISMYQASAPRFVNTLTNLSAILDKAQAHAEAKKIDFIKTIKPAQIDGSEDKNIHLKLGPREVDYKGMQYLLGHAIPNFYFHVTTAYDILRHNGVELAKRDYLANP